jgi:DNA (cytosine-5)-methyltransferase 1
VIHIWRACAPVLAAAGYSVATEVLRADEYGVPQIRERAILVARRDGKSVKLPAPTHTRWPSPSLNSNPRWVSMADALGWGMTHRPSMTVSAGGTGSGGGLEIFGNGARRGMRTELEAGRWLDDGVQRWSATGKSIRVTTQDVLRLQSFDPDTPVQGLIGQRSTQVGNAIPRLMAKAILAALVA